MSGGHHADQLAANGKFEEACLKIAQLLHAGLLAPCPSGCVAIPGLTSRRQNTFQVSLPVHLTSLACVAVLQSNEWALHESLRDSYTGAYDLTWLAMMLDLQTQQMHVESRAHAQACAQDLKFSPVCVFNNLSAIVKALLVHEDFVERANLR